MAKVNRKELVAVLDRVSPGVGSKEADIQATSFLFQEGFVYTYNDEVSVCAVLPDTMEEFECAVLAKDFGTLLNKMADEEIELFQSDAALSIVSKRIKADIVIEQEVKMPIDEIDIPEKFAPLPDDFVVALKSCLPIVGKDMSKPLSTCLHLCEDRIETSDVDRAGRYMLSKSVFKKAVYLPGTSARIVTRFAVKKFAVNTGWIHFECKDGTILSCRTYYENQEFADLTPLLEQEGTEINLPSALSDALDRSGIFVHSTDGTEVTMEDKHVKISISDNWCTVRGEGTIGRYEEKVRMTYDGKPIAFTTSAEMLAEALEKNQQCEVCSKFVKLYDENFCHLVAVEIEQKKPPKAKEGKAKGIPDDDQVPF